MFIVYTLCKNILNIEVNTRNMFLGDQRNKLNEEILIHLPNSNLVPVQRKHFNESKGASLLQQLVTTENQGTRVFDRTFRGTFQFSNPYIFATIDH